MIDVLGVSSVLDVGCGLGHTAKYFRDNDCDVLGIDGSPSAVENSVIPERVVRHDYTELAYIPECSYDMVWSAEFVEHVEPKYVDNFLATFCKSTKYVSMTHALPNQGGYHHVNEKPKNYWIQKMKKIDFKLDERMTNESRKKIDSTKNNGSQYLESGLIFRRI